MNKEELEYIKENYFSKKRQQGFNLGVLMEAIDEIYEIEKPLMERKLVREALEGTTMTLQAIPEISVTELGWTDVRTVGNQEISGPARTQLLQFLSNIQGGDLSEKIRSLAGFYSDPDSINLNSGDLGKRIANTLSYLVFYKTLTKVISNFNAASAGFNFEAFLAVLLDGKQIPANTGTIADFVTGDNKPISLKLYAEKSVVVGGSFTDLVGDLVEPQFSPHELMQYVVVMKSFEEETQGLDVRGELKFHRFNFTLDNIANIILGSMGKSVRCIEIPVEFIEQIKAGNEEYDFNATLPSQENLPSPEELEVQFIDNLTPMLQDTMQLEIEEINNLTQILNWAKNDELFKPVPMGEREMVVRGSSHIPPRGPALVNAVNMAFGEKGYSLRDLGRIRSAVSAANTVVMKSFSATKMADERTRVLSGKGVFADAQTSVEFYNQLTPELKRRALLNSRGYLSTLQFDLNRGQVLDIQNIAGEYATLPSGQDSSDIGRILIGAVYVQEVLNKLTEELNQSIFSLFTSVREIQEGTYAFMAGGLQDDAEAQKAITASQNVEEKTQELRPTEKPDLI
jgi:hypothetical protein